MWIRKKDEMIFVSINMDATDTDFKDVIRSSKERNAELGLEGKTRLEEKFLPHQFKGRDEFKQRNFSLVQ